MPEDNRERPGVLDFANQEDDKELGECEIVFQKVRALIWDSLIVFVGAL